VFIHKLISAWKYLKFVLHKQEHKEEEAVIGKLTIQVWTFVLHPFKKLFVTQLLPLNDCQSDITVNEYIPKGSAIYQGVSKPITWMKYLWKNVILKGEITKSKTDWQLKTVAGCFEKYNDKLLFKE
jgi:hypothetical protein